MEELIMDLVSLIADQVQSRTELFRDEGRIMDILLSSGYRLPEANAVLTLLQSLARDAGKEDLPAAPGAMRTMTTRERKRFTVEAFGFITKLGLLGIITAEQREEIIDKAMTLRTGRIELDEVKSLIALDILAEHGQRDDIAASFQGGRAADWN